LFYLSYWKFLAVDVGLWSSYSGVELELLYILFKLSGSVKFVFIYIPISSRPSITSLIGLNYMDV